MAWGTGWVSERWTARMTGLAGVVLALALGCAGDRGSGGSGSNDTEDEPTGGTAEGTADSTGGPPAVPVASVADLLVPFDTNTQDIEPPSGWGNQYGKPPEIVPVAHGRVIDVLVQDYLLGPEGHAYVLRLEPLGLDYVITAYMEPMMLDRIVGFDIDANDALYVASSAVEYETVDLDFPAPEVYRSGVVRVVKQDYEGNLLFDTDLDLAREMAATAMGQPPPEQLINPMTAATGRLAYGNGALALVHGINTVTDWGIMARHQKALTTHLDSGSGLVTRTSSIWVSHSFDQRMLFDGTGFIEMHLGDAFPRNIVFARVSPDSGSYPALYIKGEEGANNTFTRLGNAALIESDPTYGYLALFATEATATTDPIDPGQATVAGSRDLGVVRIRRDFYAVDPPLHIDAAMPDTLDVTSSGTPQSNRLRWLTHYQDETGGLRHAERPKLVALGGDTYVVLWERWDGSVFSGTWGVTIDAQGQEITAAAKVSDIHLSRGDDAFALQTDAGMAAAWLTGDAALRQLRLHIVDPQLVYRMVIVD